jgi:hypothetical protein
VQEKDTTRCINSEADDGTELSEEKSNDMEKDVKVIGESLRFLSFCERMK